MRVKIQRSPDSCIQEATGRRPDRAAAVPSQGLQQCSVQGRPVLSKVQLPLPAERLPQGAWFGSYDLGTSRSKGSR